MKYLVASLLFMCTHQVWAARLTINNKTQFPVEVKINKNSHHSSLAPEAISNFEFESIAALRFFVKCRDLRTCKDTVVEDKGQKFQKHVSWRDTYDVDEKIIFWQASRSGQSKLMKQWQLNPEHFFNLVDRHSEVVKQFAQPSDYPPEVMADAVKMQQTLATMMGYLMPPLVATEKDEEEEESKAGGGIAGLFTEVLGKLHIAKHAPAAAFDTKKDQVNHDEISKVKRKHILHHFCQHGHFDSSLFTEQTGDLTVIITLDENKKFEFEFENAHDGLVHFHFTKSASYHSGSMSSNRSVVRRVKSSDSKENKAMLAFIRGIAD